jgi:hypothetical protein
MEGTKGSTFNTQAQVTTRGKEARKEVEGQEEPPEVLLKKKQPEKLDYATRMTKHATF